MSSDPALFELLDGLRHDLAKYLGLPLRMLPPEAPAAVLRDALEEALLRTRRRGAETLCAREIYRAARAELLAEGAAPARLRSLDDAVEAALSRPAIERDFARVADELTAWLAEVGRG